MVIKNYLKEIQLPSENCGMLESIVKKVNNSKNMDYMIEKLKAIEDIK